MNSLDPNVVRHTAPVLAATPVASSSVDGMELDPKRILKAIRRHLLTVTVIPALCVVIAAIVTVLTPKQYQAVATVQIEEKSSKVLSTDDTQPAALAQDADRFLQTQIGLLNSKALAGEVVDSLNLAKDDAALRQLGMPAQAAAQLTTPAARRDALAAMVRNGLTVTLPRDSRIAQVAFKGPSPELCARIANAYVHDFILYNLQRRFQDSSYALSFLRDQLSQAKQRLEDSERAKVAYATRSRLVEAPGPGAAGHDTRAGDITTSTTSHLQELTTALSAAQAARIEAEQRWDTAQHMPLMSLPEVLQSSAIQSLMEQRAVAEAEYRKERERRKPDFPAMLQASAQIAELDNQTKAIATSVRDSLHNRFSVALKNEAALRSQLDQIKSTALDEEGLSIEYNILGREVDTNRTMYDGLLQRYKEVSAASGVTANNITAVDSAEVPRIPVSPKVKMNLASAGLLGVLLALAVVFIREKVSDKIRAEEDALQKLGVRCLGALPDIPIGSTVSGELENPKSAFSEATVSIRALLEFMVVSPKCTSIAVTSSHPTDSRLAFASGLAHDLAKSGRRALLIDADLRMPGLYRVMRRSNHLGLADVLAGGCSAATAIQEEVSANLDFLPAGPAPLDPTELLSGRRLSNVIEELGQSYGVIVLNVPPATHVADTFLVAAFFDATVMVVDANVTDADTARAAIERLCEVGANVCGVVLSKFGPARASVTVVGSGSFTQPRIGAEAERISFEQPRKRRRNAGRPRWA